MPTSVVPLAFALSAWLAYVAFAVAAECVWPTWSGRHDGALLGGFVILTAGLVVTFIATFPN